MFIKTFLNFNKFCGNYICSSNHYLFILFDILPTFYFTNSLLNQVSHVHLPSFRIIIPMRLSPNQIERTMTFLATLHSMARANLKESKYFSTSTTTASKYIPKRPRICINWNPLFQTQIYLVNVPLNVNIVKQDLLNKKQFLKILWSEVWKGGFQLMQILGLFGMYFDSVVVEVEKYLLFFRLALAILWIELQYEVLDLCKLVAAEKD